MRNLTEPLSTISNIFYVLVAFAIYRQDPDNELLSATMLALGLASTAFHYSGSKEDTPYHRADEGAIYVVLCVLLYQAWAIDWLFWPCMAGATMLFMFAGYPKVDLMKIAPALSVALIAGLFVKGGLAAGGAVLVTALMAGFVRLNIEQSDATHAMWLSSALWGFIWPGWGHFNISR